MRAWSERPRARWPRRRSALGAARGRLQRAGHGRPAEVQAAPAEHVLRRRPVVAADRAGDGRPGPAPRQAGVRHRRGRRQARRLHPAEGVRPGREARPGRGPRGAPDGPGAGPRAVQHLLLPLPRPDRRRQRDDRPARVLAAPVVLRRSDPAPRGPRRALLRRHHQRLRRDVFLRLADPAGRPLGDRRLHPGLATEPARHARRPARRPSGRGPRRTARRQLRRRRPRPAPPAAGRIEPARPARRASAASACSPASAGWAVWLRRGPGRRPGVVFPAYLVAYVFCVGIGGREPGDRCCSTTWSAATGGSSSAGRWRRRR